MPRGSGKGAVKMAAKARSATRQAVAKLTEVTGDRGSERPSADHPVEELLPEPVQAV